MAIKKTFTLVFLIIAICAVGAGCVYLVGHINEVMRFSRQKQVAIPVLITGTVCIIAALTKSIMETLQK